MTSKKAKPRYRYYPILWINYIFIVLLLLTNLTPYIAPDIFWPMTIFGLMLPAIVLINVFFVILWIFLLKRYILYSLLAIILSYSLIFDHIQYNKSEPILIKDSTSIDIVSFNARNLSNNNHNYGDKLIRAQIIEYAANQNADIFSFQEFQTYPTKKINTVEDFKYRLQLKYSYSTQYLLNNTEEFIDLLVVFSKFPIVNSQDFYLDGKSYGFYIDMDINGKIIRLFNFHLESNHFSSNDYQIFTETEAAFDERKRNHIIWLLQKLKKYSVKRSFQARTIKEEIKKSPYPVIITGDFNDTPASFAYQKISNGLTDAFKEKGSGYCNTYNGDLPPMRIDYMLFDTSFIINNYEVLKVDLSDHYPIKVNFNY